MPGTEPALPPTWVAIIAAATLGACTTVAQDPYEQTGAGPSPAEEAVDACNLRGHLQCIYLTGRETLADGAQLKWTRHWWRMSYIGRACERRYGRTTGILLEGLFAIPHYSAIAIGNGLATLARPFRAPGNDDDAIAALADMRGRVGDRVPGYNAATNGAAAEPIGPGDAFPPHPRRSNPAGAR